MQYKTFRNLALVGVLSALAGISWGGIRLFSGTSASNDPASTASVQSPAPTTSDPVPANTVAATPASVEPAPPAPNTPPTTGELRALLDQWLTVNGDRRGQMRWNDIFPTEPYKISAVRFPDSDAAKFSNDPSQWSQFRLDLDRDGHDDEKWLLKNGRTYKREVLGHDGKSVVGKPEYFNK